MISMGIPPHYLINLCLLGQEDMHTAYWAINKWIIVLLRYCTILKTDCISKTLDEVPRSDIGCSPS